MKFQSPSKYTKIFYEISESAIYMCIFNGINGIGNRKYLFSLENTELNKNEFENIQITRSKDFKGLVSNFVDVI